MVTQITPINLVPGTMIPRVNISQYDTGARVLKFQVYNGDSLFTFTNAMTVALVGTKPDGKGFSYEGTIASNMPTFDVTAQMSAVAGKVRAELIVFENGERCGSGNFVIFVEEGALGDGTDMSESDYAIINDALDAAFDLEHFYADLQGMVAEAVEDIQVIQGQTVIDPTLSVSGAAADAKATGDKFKGVYGSLIEETVTGEAVTFDDGAENAPVKQIVANIQPMQSGTGDPSPDNVRPITGYTAVTITRSNGLTPPGDTETYTVTMPTEAGTVYGGTLTVNDDGSGSIVVNRKTVNLSSSMSWASTGTVGTNFRIYTNFADHAPQTDGWAFTDIWCSHLEYLAGNPGDFGTFNYTFAGNFSVKDANGVYGTKTALLEWLDGQITAGTPVQVEYPIVPVTYALTTPQVKTLLGNNSISMDADGNMSVTYRASTEIYIDKRFDVLMATDGDTW